jgi:hypothetical protein
MPKGKPDQPFDWSQQEASIAIPPGLKALGTAAANVATNIGTSVTGVASLGFVAIAALAVLVVMNKTRRAA